MSHPPQMDRIPVKGFALRSRARQRHALPFVILAYVWEGGCLTRPK